MAVGGKISRTCVDWPSVTWKGHVPDDPRLLPSEMEWLLHPEGTSKRARCLGRQGDGEFGFDSV